MEFSPNFSPKRIISLVPSYTESLFDLGFGQRLVGRTDYCIYPAEKVKNIPCLGGPKTPNVAEIIQLKPDIILANQEENSREAVEQLRDAGIFVWVSYPKDVMQTIQFLWDLVRLFRDERAAQIVEHLEKCIELIGLSQKRSFRYFCPVWFSDEGEFAPWWMTFNEDTYSDNLISLFGGENVFVKHGISNKIGGETKRYPKVTAGEIVQAKPEVVLFPDEPYKFTKDDIKMFMEKFPELPAVKNNQLYLLDGSLITWCGTRLGKAITELPFIFSAIETIQN